MKYTVMKCDCCGETFYSEYWTGGYIDHTNLSRNWHIIVNRGEKEIISEICRHGNELRRKEDVDIRLNCFKHYCKKESLPNEILEKVENDVLSYIERLKELAVIHDEIVDILNKHNCSGREREYIGAKYQALERFWERK